MVQPPSSDNSLVPLSRWRAALARARRPGGSISGRGLVDALLAGPDPAAFIPSLPVQELYYAIREIGLHDAHELVALASPEQVRGFVDLAAWRRDEFLADNAAEWIDAVVEAGPERLVKVVHGLDEELIGLFLHRQVRVYDLSLEEEPPEEPEGHFYSTPDTFFVIDVLPPGEAGKRIDRFIEWLYRGNDLDLARATVMSAKWGLDSVMSESALRWRNARMADLGFSEHYEALSVYAYLDPTPHAPPSESMPLAESATTLPVVVSAVGGGTLFARALATIAEPETLGRLHGALLTLANRVMAADLVEPGDFDTARATLARTADWISLALEYLSRGDVERAGEALATRDLTNLFRIGVSLAQKLKRAADTLVRDGWVTLVPGRTSLLPDDLSVAMAAARELRPRYARAGVLARPFANLAELAEIAGLVEAAAQLGDTVRRGLGVDPSRLTEEALASCQPERGAITFEIILATLIANALLDRPPLLVPLAPADIAPLKAKALAGGQLRTEVTERMRQLFTQRFAERSFVPPATWEGQLTAALEHLAASLAPSAVGAPGALPGTTVGLIVRG